MLPSVPETGNIYHGETSCMSPIVGDILYEDVPLVKSVYIVFSCISDELPQETQVFVVYVFVGRLSSAY